MSETLEVKKITIGDGQPVENLGEVFRRVAKPLYPELAETVGLLQTVCKALVDGADPTGAPVSPGTKQHPFDYSAATKLRLVNIHHGTCLEAAKMAMGGLGHEDDKASKLLTPLCKPGTPWMVVLLKMLEDFCELGNGLLEVVRGPGGAITGIHHIPAPDAHLVVEENSVDVHWSIRGGEVNGVRVSDNRSLATVMAQYGDLDGFRKRQNIPADRRISEVIHFAAPTNKSRHYGLPDWLAAVASMELVQALNQHQFDFHVNRGVPEFITFLTGGRVDSKTWQTIQTAMQAHVGVGNSHKSSVFNLTDPNIKAQVEKLAMEGIANGEFYRAMSETLSVNIVSAHRTPPSIAGIMIPGKMGAANETSNALLAYQALKIGPMQTIVEQILDATLGNPALNGGLGLAAGDFDLKTIVDEMAENVAKLAPLNTIGGMKQSLPSAAAAGRDVNAGLKKAEDAPDVEAVVEALLARVIAKIAGGA